MGEHLSPAIDKRDSILSTTPYNRQYADYRQKGSAARGATAAGSEVKKGKEGVEEEC